MARSGGRSGCALLVEMTCQGFGAGGCAAVGSLDLRVGAPVAWFLILAPHVVGGVGGVVLATLHYHGRGGEAVVLYYSTVEETSKTETKPMLGFEKFLQPQIPAPQGQNSQSASELAWHLAWSQANYQSDCAVLLNEWLSARVSSA